MTILELCRAKINRSCDVKRHKHCAMAFSKSGKLIASATNRISDDGYVSDWSLHAEEMLVKKLRKLHAKERFGFIRILVVRMPKGQEWGMSKPCDGCQRLIEAYGVNEVSYTGEDGKIVNM
jgi:hypothetical protein